MNHTNGFKIPAPPAALAPKASQAIKFVGKQKDANGDEFAVYFGSVAGM